MHSPRKIENGSFLKGLVFDGIVVLSRHGRPRWLSLTPWTLRFNRFKFMNEGA